LFALTTEGGLPDHCPQYNLNSPKGATVIQLNPNENSNLSGSDVCILLVSTCKIQKKNMFKVITVGARKQILNN
jgi:benzoyl-CoA reductase/2-hydroxyglutaryl-CoA dehydratase subunit BcrC/BadD/HgdB